ncbi:hypothetical protein GCM10011577_11180 [Pseudarthrobacter polychromogenes]|uniref:Uncharacterized protein n=1 Tax=Pseudarthrobacter polychromogenes TaxID=1676 RepID=A0ABQ1XDU2_9MICC|nr:hypothetical protein GCM10011577_11180 [Pseudarthrobacter polychromogenes]
MTKHAGDPARNPEHPGIVWAPRQYGRGVETMTITEYVAALGGMLASLGGAGLLAAGLIRFRARH